MGGLPGFALWGFWEQADRRGGARDELLESLRATLVEALEMNRANAKQAAGKGYEELTIAV